MLQAWPGRSGKEELDQNSPNLGTTFSPIPVLLSPPPCATFHVASNDAEIFGSREERGHCAIQGEGGEGGKGRETEGDQGGAAIQ